MDVMPNSWILGPRHCIYPSEKPSYTINKWAKEGTAPDFLDPAKPPSGWEMLKIQIIQRDYDSFQRAMVDLTRIAKGLPTVAESESEQRGRGLRKKKAMAKEVRKNVNEDDDLAKRTIDSFSSVDSSFIEDLEDQPSSSPKKPREECADGPSHQLPSPPSCKPMLQCGIKLPTTLPQLPQGLRSQAESSKATGDQKLCSCPIKPGLFHHCAVSPKGDMTLESLGRSQCQLSRCIVRHTSFTKRKAAEQDLRLAKLEAEASCSKKVISHEDEKKILELFPIKTMKELEEFEEMLKSPTLLPKVVEAVEPHLSKTNDNKRARSFLALVLDRNLRSKFSWKGQQRKNSPSKLKFADRKICNLMKKSVEAMHEDSYRPNWLQVEKSVQDMFSHAKTEPPKDDKDGNENRDAENQQTENQDPENQNIQNLDN